MLRLTGHGVFLDSSGEILDGNFCPDVPEGRTRTMTYRILKEHNQSGDMESLRLKFDALVSPDNNYVNILQTARRAKKAAVFRGKGVDKRGGMCYNEG